MTEIVSLLCADVWSGCAVWLESPGHFLDRSSFENCCFAKDSIRNMLSNLTQPELSQCSFLLRGQWTIEWLSRAMSGALVRKIFLQTQLPISCHIKEIRRHSPKFTNYLNVFWTIELSQYSKSGSSFSYSEPVAADSDCHWLGNVLYLCLPVWPA